MLKVGSTDSQLNHELSEHERLWEHQIQDKLQSVGAPNKEICNLIKEKCNELVSDCEKWLQNNDYEAVLESE